MNQKLCLVFVFAVVLVSGCVQQPEPVTEIKIPGHPTYTFSNDVRIASGINATDTAGIRNAILGAEDNITVVFDGSFAEDNTYFTVVAYNIVTKIQTFFVYNGRVMEFPTYYFIGSQWLDGSGNNIEEPMLSGTVVRLKGPNTGATGTSVSLENSTITVEGASYKNLTLAGDKLVLIVLGVEVVR